MLSKCYKVGVGAWCDRAAKSWPSPGCRHAGAVVCCWLRCRPWRPGAPVARRRAHVEVPVKRSCPAACGPSARGYYGAVRAFLGPRTHGFSIVPPWFKGGRSFCALAARPRAACAAAGTRQRKQGCRGRGRAPPHGRPECTALVSVVAWAGQHRTGCPCNQSACCASTGGHGGGRGVAVRGQQARDRL